jgi:hypothetical protein
MPPDPSTSVAERLPGLTPTPAELRAELEELIVGDLLGPAQGETETLPGSVRVRDRYIAGMLAPRETVAMDPERQERTESAGGTSEASDDTGSDDAQGQAAPKLFPSSLGMSFTVSNECEAVLARVGWGKYTKERAEAEADGATVWQRYPVTGDVIVALVAGDLGPFAPVADQPEVLVRGRAVKLARGWLVSLFLVNEQLPPERNKDVAWLFQASLSVQSPDGAPVFSGRIDVLEDNALPGEIGEIALLDLQYRNRVEFAVGHGTGTKAQVALGDPTRAQRIETTAVPTHEVPVTEAPGPNDPTLDPGVAAKLSSVVFDMQTLAGLNGDAMVAALEPLVDAYDRWLGIQDQRLTDGVDRIDQHRAAGAQALSDARVSAQRLREGIALLARRDGLETETAEAFRFANHVMWQQRIHALASELRRTDENLDLSKALGQVDKVTNRSWRPFQLAFLLLNVPALSDPAHPERSGEGGLVDLLFFPTGGGKTEAYLGLTAFTLAIRRLQGMVAGRDGRSGGMAVLMRYTLRLLTAQQFERAAALICACELRRRELLPDDPRWGSEPFRLGMWVGANVAPNRTKDASYSLEDAKSSGKRRTGTSTPVQLVACPWCGTRLDPAKDAKSDIDRWRTLLFCADQFGSCPFTQAGSPDEGLPVVTVDEELYRLLPAFVISTADKWAQLPWRGPLHLLFGSVSQRCERHGYRSIDLDTIDPKRPERNKHNKTGQLPAAQTVPVEPLRPPDLIIQDELHLISGPLGTLVGLYETAIDELASWTVDGVTVRPKVIASTATVRRAEEQVFALFARKLAVFPTPVLDVEDSFFAKERPTDERAGRRYVGLCAPGLRLKSAEVRIFTAILASTQRLYDRYGVDADPWMTLVAYFSALRELAGTRRLLDDEIRVAAYRAGRRGLGQRKLNRSGIEELTSRVGSGEIRKVLDRLKQRFDPAETESLPPIDVLLATNMISVGVDVGRLGMMCVVGQPKTTSEYIQATSRVGRSEVGPGLVVTLYNWARPRDLSHYETFEHYHSTFYRQVEALSVTPFSARALDRGLSAVLVALARQNSLHPSWNPNGGAQNVDLVGADLKGIVDKIVARAETVTSDPETGKLVRDLLNTRLDTWKTEQDRPGNVLGYAADTKKSIAALLDVPGVSSWDTFTCAWSLRETEPTVNLIIDSYDSSMNSAPPFELGMGSSVRPASNTVEDEDIENEEEGVLSPIGLEVVG